MVTSRFLTRRSLFRLAAALSGAAMLPRCGFDPEEGAAYTPWSFPDPTRAPLLQVVHAGLLAANPHDTQPWRFVVTPDRVRVFVDRARSLGAMDPLGRERIIGLGCAIENMVVWAPEVGLVATVVARPDPDSPDLVADVLLATAKSPRSELAGGLARRKTHRGRYGEFPLDPALGRELGRLASDPVVALTTLTDARMDTFRDGTRRATRAIVDDAEMNDASHAWYRHTKEEIDRHRDGLTLDAQSLGAFTTAAGKTLGRPSAADAGGYWIANTEEVHTGPVTAFAILSTRALEDVGELLQVGRVYQRLHLFAAREGLAMQPLNQLPERRDRERQKGLRPDLEPVLASLAEGHAQMAFRIGVAWDDTHHSPRRPVEWVTEVTS